MNPIDEQKSDGNSLDDRLVAYLDGELDADSQSQLERQLADDAPSRDRLRELQQTWDLLDHLPSAQTNRTFTETTVEMVAAQASEDIQTQEQILQGQQRRSWAYGGGIFAAAILLGYLAFYAVAARRENKMLSDLPVIENMDLYRHTESVPFLQQLDQDALFGSEELADEEPSGPVRLFSDFDVTSIRRQAYELTSAEKAQLQDKKDRFEELAPEIQAQRRRLHAEVVASPDAERLFQVMAQYHEWLTSLDTEDRSQLLALAPQERLKKIEVIKGQQDSELFLRLVTGRMTTEDFAVILDWRRKFATRHRDSAISNLPENERGLWEKLPEPRKSFHLFRFLPEPTDKEIDELAGLLSGDAQAALKTSTEAGERAEFIGRCLGAAIHSRRRPHVEPEELERFFLEELEEKKQQELAKMDPMDADRHLRRLYFEQRFNRSGFRGGPPGWGRRPDFGSPDSRRDRPPRGFSDGPRDPDGRGRRSFDNRGGERGRERGREGGPEFGGRGPFEPRDGGLPGASRPQGPDQPQQQRAPTVDSPDGADGQ